MSTELPDGPWRSVGVDFLGPLPTGDYILVVVDYYNRFYEIDIMRSTTADRTVRSLEVMFARHGLPQVIVSDSGPQFISGEFRDFLEVNGIKHQKVTPKWAQANGEVERQNKSILKISHTMKKDWKRELTRYLAVYRTTPHPLTGKTPAELLMGRALRTKLPELERVIVDEEVKDRDLLLKWKSRQYADVKLSGRHSDVRPGDSVLLCQEARDKFSTKFEPRVYDVVSRYGNQVTISDRNDANRRRWKRNITHVKRFYGSRPQTDDVTVEDTALDDLMETVHEEGPAMNETQNPEPQRRYPLCIKKKPDRLDL
ncbi:uncharacterized protein LOC117116022 [Anneissia japonica]|uniref:uncharacterized protein LOC117116022 n=1 Tax=Anneissia japonica TaxID=1529436 RepID=UPI001425636A|nr:uncharacterized protein LOC117116022 [Anneissia japonica]